MFDNVIRGSYMFSLSTQQDQLLPARHLILFSIPSLVGDRREHYLVIRVLSIDYTMLFGSHALREMTTNKIMIPFPPLGYELQSSVSNIALTQFEKQKSNPIRHA